MTISKKQGLNIYGVNSYSYPKLHTGKKWYIDFLCYDPIDNIMRRKKYHLDGIKSIRERKSYASQLISKLSDRLRKGWNVWAEHAENSRHYTQYNDIVDFYIRYLNKMKETGIMKKSTYLSYNSYFHVFNEWSSRQANKIIYVYQLNNVVANDFLDYILYDLDNSPQTRNNYKGWLNSFCSWLVEKNFLSENPCEGIHKIRVAPKKREQFSSEQLGQLREFLLPRNKYYYLACMLEYYCFIRPNEMTYLKIQDVYLKAQKIVLSGTFTKNRHDAAVGLNSKIIRLLIDLKIFEYPGNYYLFGRKDFKPGINQIDSREFRDTFVKVRKSLRWNDVYQFYGLKDSGIRDLANSEGIVIARDQARHSDISTTNKYLKGSSMPVHEETKNFEGLL
jgi:integrase